MWIGGKHVESPFIELGQLSTTTYFFFFLALISIISLIENFVYSAKVTKF